MIIKNVFEKKKNSLFIFLFVNNWNGRGRVFKSAWLVVTCKLQL